MLSMNYMAMARRGQFDESSLAQNLQPRDAQYLWRIREGQDEARLPQISQRLHWLICAQMKVTEAALTKGGTKVYAAST